MHRRAGYKQSIPLTWLQAPSEQDRVALLEYSRGALYSLSNTNKRHGGEVHISRIRHVFDKLGSPGLSRVGMKLLNFLREAENLPGGYWIPTPFRVLEIEGYPVFIGALPNSFDSLGEIQTEGLCRILKPEIAERFPRQDIDSWMGRPSLSPSHHASAFIRQHQCTASPSNIQTDIEFINFKFPATKHAQRDRNFFWSSAPTALIDGHIALCRQKQFGFYRYFSADIRSGRPISEAAIDPPISRLIFSLANHIGSPIHFAVRRTVDNTEISISEHLPAEEYRLALLLSRRISRQGKHRTFYLAPGLAPTLIRTLQELGCTMEAGK